MGGAKKKTIAQSEKRQRIEASKQEKHGKSKLTQTQASLKNMMVPKVDEAEAAKIFGSMKAVTIYSTAKSLGMNASMAWSLIKNLESKSILEKVGGYSGHYVYRYIGGSKSRR